MMKEDLRSLVLTLFKNDDELAGAENTQVQTALAATFVIVVRLVLEWAAYPSRFPCEEVMQFCTVGKRLQKLLLTVETVTMRDAITRLMDCCAQLQCRIQVMA